MTFASDSFDGSSAAGKVITVGIADLHVAAEPNGMLITHALGSCIAVVVYDRLRKAGGMIHFMLPDSSIAPHKAKAQPAMFGDTGVPLLFEKIQRFGVLRHELEVKVAGASTFYEGVDVFDVGKRNIASVRNVLSKLGVRAKSEDVGGRNSRTVRLLLATGKVFVRTPAGEQEL